MQWPHLIPPRPALPRPCGFPGTARCSDFTDPLETWEQPRRSLRSVLAWLPSQLAPFLPAGMRHVSQPHTGAMARNRLMALGAAHRSAGSVLLDVPLASRATTRTLITCLSQEQGLFLDEASKGSDGKEAAGADDSPAAGSMPAAEARV